MAKKLLDFQDVLKKNSKTKSSRNYTRKKAED